MRRHARIYNVIDDRPVPPLRRQRWWERFFDSVWFPAVLLLTAVGLLSTVAALAITGRIPIEVFWVVCLVALLGSRR